MIFSDLYRTIISCNSYNMTIENTLSVTVSLVDFNGDAVVDKEITVKVSDGVFSESNKSSYTGTTDSNGELVVTYVPSDWGNHLISCNGESVQVHVVGGWKRINGITVNPPVDNVNYMYVSNMKGYYNQDMVRLDFQLVNTHPPNNSVIARLPDIGFIKPSNSVCFPTHLAKGELYLNSDGELRCADVETVYDTQYCGVYYVRSDFTGE